MDSLSMSQQQHSGGGYYSHSGKATTRASSSNFSQQQQQQQQQQQPQQQSQQQQQQQQATTRKKRKDENSPRYQSGMRPSIVTTINNTNPNNNDPSIPTRLRQRTNEPYESYIEDSFVGHWEHEDDEDEYQEDFDAESHDGYEEKSELHHPSTIEFDFDSFGPESIIYSPSAATPTNNNATTALPAGMKSAAAASSTPTSSSRPPPLIEVSTEAENAGDEEASSTGTITAPKQAEPTEATTSSNRSGTSGEQPKNETPIADALLKNNNPSNPSAHRDGTNQRALNYYNYPTQEYLVDPAQIDLKVIEPYKKVISHAGYCNHFDPSVPSEPSSPPGSQPPAVIVFSACYLPDRSRRDYNYVMDHLFLYVLTSLHELIADDYILIYLHNTQPAASPSSRTSSRTSSTTGASPGCAGPSGMNNMSVDDNPSRNNLPTFTWMKRCYQMIDRRLRKNLRILYLVKPTFWLKTIVIMCKPFISAKFSKKLRFVEDMNALRKCLPVDKLILPASAENL
uniref:Protein prune 2 n=1 Tax=Aceria tosichella TaxID=561515 RepID=A0A6G1SKQ1_9ACAR